MTKSHRTLPIIRCETSVSAILTSNFTCAFFTCAFHTCGVYMPIPLHAQSMWCTLHAVFITRAIHTPKMTITRSFITRALSHPIMISPNRAGAEAPIKNGFWCIKLNGSLYTLILHKIKHTMLSSAGLKFSPERKVGEFICKNFLWLLPSSTTTLCMRQWLYCFHASFFPFSQQLLDLLLYTTTCPGTGSNHSYHVCMMLWWRNSTGRPT